MADKLCELHISEAKGNAREVSVNFQVETNQELIDRHNMGKTAQTCKLCGASGEFQTWKALESYIGLRDEFNYFECPGCETLQIEKFPDSIQRYFPGIYFAFSPPRIEPVRMGAPEDRRMILDVGCGFGAFLCYLATLGCVNLHGCDPFIDKDITYSNGVKIKKCTMHEMDGEYDVIRLAQTFAHMRDPHEAFQDFDRLLKREKGASPEDPKIEIITPIFPNAAFEIYGPFWYQLDAPRHCFIHSVKSITMLAEKYGFKIKDIKYDEPGTQFLISRLGQFNVPFSQWQQRLAQDNEFEGLREQAELFNILGKYAALNERADQVLLTLVRG